MTLSLNPEAVMVTLRLLFGYRRPRVEGFSTPTLLYIRKVVLAAAIVLPATCLLGQERSNAISPYAADIYLGTTKGVYLYHSASNGTIKRIAVSPFPRWGSLLASLKITL
jgi:hypothetical protein